VLFELSAGGARLDTSSGLRETRFPVALSAFTPGSWSSNRSVRYEEYPIQANGVHYTASVWFGAQSPTADRNAVAAIVASIRFPGLRTAERAGSYVVLGRTSSYPIGTVARFGRSTFPRFDAPFYLIHDQNGFHALAWPAGMFPPKYRPPCDVQLDRPRFQFFCPRGGRWDSLGNVIVEPPGFSPPAQLVQKPISISSDGHVLVSLIGTGHLATPTRPSGP
jgi:hypothetical protein